MYTRRTFPEFMSCKYVTLKDLTDRLDSTVCRYGGKLVYVRVKSTASEVNLILYDWPNVNSVIKTIKPDDPLLDISLLDLGYFNYVYNGENFALYPYRLSSKKYKQGTYTGYVYIKDIAGEPHGIFSGQALQSPGFCDSIEGNYPDLSVLEEKGLKQIALSPDVAVRKDGLGVLEFFWRTTKVGIKIPGKEIHRQKNEFSWVVDRIIGEFL